MTKKESTAMAILFNRNITAPHNATAMRWLFIAQTAEDMGRFFESQNSRFDMDVWQRRCGYQIKDGAYRRI